MRQRVGSCSLCGGDVTGIRGPWMSVSPPPPDTCSSCGATAQRDVIQMHPRRNEPAIDRIIREEGL